MHVTERKTADMYRKKPSRQHYDAAAAISLRLEKESNLVVGNLTGSYSCSLHCLVYSSNTSRKSSQPLSGIRMELRKLPFTSLMVMYRPCAFFLQEKKKFLFSILTCLDWGAFGVESGSPSSYSSISSFKWLLNSSIPSAGMKIWKRE